MVPDHGAHDTSCHIPPYPGPLGHQDGGDDGYDDCEEFPQPPVAARIDQIDGIVPAVGVAIQGLGIARGLDIWIRLEEAAELGVVGAAGEEDEAGAGVLALARKPKGVRGGGLGAVGSDGAIGRVLGVLHDRPRAVGDDVGTAEVVGVIKLSGQVAQWPSDDCGNTLRTGEDVVGGLAARLFLHQLAQVGRRAAGGDLLDPAAVAIVDEADGDVSLGGGGRNAQPREMSPIVYRGSG